MITTCLWRCASKIQEYKVVAYVNTTTDIKTLSDVCVTSSSAVKIVKKYERERYFVYSGRKSGSMGKNRCRRKILNLCLADAQRM